MIANDEPTPRKRYASPSYGVHFGQAARNTTGGEANTTGYTGRAAGAGKPKAVKAVKVKGYGNPKAAIAPKPKYTKPPAPKTPQKAGAPAASALPVNVPPGSTVASVYGPLFAALSAQRSSISNTALADAQKQRAWALEVAKQLQGTAPAIQGIYQSAATDDSTFAKGFSDGMQHALGQSKDQVNAILQNNGAPAGQLQSQQPITDTGDVLYGLGGYLPASTLEKQGAAFASAAAFLPNEALSRGQQAASDVMAQARKDLFGVDQQQYNLMSEQAKQNLDQQAAQATLEFQRQQAKQAAQQRQQALAQENRQWNATYGLNVAKARSSAQIAQDRLAQQQQLAHDRLAQSQARLNQSAKQYQTTTRLRIASIFGVDPATGQPTLAAQKAAKAEAKNRKAAARLTPYQRTRLGGDAGSLAQNASSGFATTDPTPKFKSTTPNDPAGWTEQQQKPDGTVYYINHNPPIGYQQAITEGLNHGIPLAIILPALNRYYKKGERGRPMQSIYQRRAAAKRK